MKLTVQLEEFKSALPEMEPFFPDHWKELALHQEEISLDVDYDRYHKLAEMGILKIITVRDSGKLIGYHWVLVNQHLHYKSTVYAMTDVYYVHPNYRKGNIGVKLFQESEKILRLLGVKVMAVFAKEKINPGVGATLEYAGFKNSESVYVKLLEGK